VVQNLARIKVRRRDQCFTDGSDANQRAAAKFPRYFWSSGASTSTAELVRFAAFVLRFREGTSLCGNNGLGCNAPPIFTHHRPLHVLHHSDKMHRLVWPSFHKQLAAVFSHAHIIASGLVASLSVCQHKQREARKEAQHSMVCPEALD